MPERIRQLVFVNAFVLLDGQCVLDELPLTHRQLMHRLAVRGRIELPYPIWRRQFMNDATPGLARQCHRRLVAQDMAFLQERLELETFYRLDIPRCYIHATDDILLSGVGDYGWHPHMSQRLGVFQLLEMPGGHEMLFTRPRELASRLMVAVDQT